MVEIDDVINYLENNRITIRVPINDGLDQKMIYLNEEQALAIYLQIMKYVGIVTAHIE